MMKLIKYGGAEMKKYAWLVTGILFVTQLILTPVSASGRSTVPEGTVFHLRMETGLSSETARIGDHFKASLIDPVAMDGRVIIPAGSMVEGRVISVTRAKRMSKSGTIGIDFDSVRLPDGRTFNVQGELTAVNSRDQKGQVDEEGHVKGEDTTDRSVVFIGGGVGVGAVIGAISGGGRGAAAGAASGAAMGTAAVLLMKGNEAKVNPGTEFGMRLMRPLDVVVQTNSGPPNLNQNYSSRRLLRRAQEALTDKGFYDGPIDGLSGPRTRSAIRDFQHSRNLDETGQLDGPTAHELGLDRDKDANTQPNPPAGNDNNDNTNSTNSNANNNDSYNRPATGPGAPVLVRVINGSAERTADGNIRVTILTEVNTGGWRVFADNTIQGDTLDVYARGLAPDRMATQVIQRLTIDAIVTGDLTRIRKIVIHGSDPDAITVRIDQEYHDSANWTRKLADIEQQSLDILGSYRADLGMTSRTSSEFDPSRSYTEDQIQLLFSLENFSNSAKLFARMDSKITDQSKRTASMRGGAESMLKEFSDADRLIGSVGVSDEVYKSWNQLRQDVSAVAEQFHIDISNVRAANR
jgi:peptidoglycan hydrolase-like protein with peptidoglycan-binding domain